MEEKSRDYASSNWNFITYICSFKIIFFLFLLRPLWIIVQVKSFFFYFVYFFFYSPLLHYILTAIFHSSSPLSLYPYLPFPLDQLLLHSFLNEKSKSLCSMFGISTEHGHIIQQGNIKLGKDPSAGKNVRDTTSSSIFQSPTRTPSYKIKNIYAKDLAQTHSGSIQS